MHRLACRERRSRKLSASLNTALHAAAVTDQLVFALCGHLAEGGEVHAMYTHQETFPLKVLQEAVDRLEFGVV